MLVSQIESLNQKIAAAEETLAALVKLEDSYRTLLTAGRVDVLTYHAAWNDMAAGRMGLLVMREQLAEAVVGLELATGLYRIPQAAPQDEEMQP